MDLLPKKLDQFHTRDYWDSFFKKRGAKAFEWYGSYADFKPIFDRPEFGIQKSNSVLVIGCGNSESSSEMYDSGYTNITNIDFSSVVIDEMQKKNVSRPNMKWIEMDFLNMAFPDKTFDVVFDKGGLDALYSEPKKSVEAKVDKLFSEILRVAKDGGMYVCITLSQEHILDKLLNYFDKNGLDVHYYKMTLDNSSLCPFLVQIKKRGDTKPSQMFSHVSKLATPTAVSKTHLKSLVEEAQNLYSTQKLTKQIGFGIVSTFSLFMHKKDLQPTETKTESKNTNNNNEEELVKRYDVTVVDSKIWQGGGQYGVFIVPQGREHEWLFSHEKGLADLSASAQYARMFVVKMVRGQNYTGLEQVQAELSPKILELCPDAKGKIPFMTSFGGVGNRKTVATFNSELSGQILVEDIEMGDDEWFRRLLFQSNLSVVQSEGKLTADKKIEFGHLAFDYHKVMVAACSTYHSSYYLDAFPPEKQDFRCDLIGLGSGALAVFLDQFLFAGAEQTQLFLNPKKEESKKTESTPTTETKTETETTSETKVEEKKTYPFHLTVVDLDKTIVEIARKMFDFPADSEDQRLRVVVDDGIAHIKTLASQNTETHDLIIFDVDSKDSTVGMSCPPESFVEEPFLRTVKSLLRKPLGMLVVNLSARDSDLYKEVVGTFKKVFETVIEWDVQEDVNKVIVCLTLPLSSHVNKKWLKETANKVDRKMKLQQTTNVELGEVIIEHYKQEPPAPAANKNAGGKKGGGAGGNKGKKRK